MGVRCKTAPGGANNPPAAHDPTGTVTHGPHPVAAADPRMAAARPGVRPHRRRVRAALAVVGAVRGAGRVLRAVPLAGTARPAVARAGADRLLRLHGLGRAHRLEPLRRGPPAAAGVPSGTPAD